MTEVLQAAVGKYRWRIVALLFFATTINYIDRNVLSFVSIDGNFRCDMLGLPHGSVLSLDDEKLFKELYGKVDAGFKLAYGLGFIFMGWFIDRVGVRLGYTVSIAIWGVSALAHAFIGSISGLRLVRFTLGIGEAGNFPSAIKTVSEWFPVKERSKAVGIFNAGANIGIIATAVAVPFLLANFGWNKVFLFTSVFAFILLVMWQIVYRKPADAKGLDAAELDYINSDKEVVDTRKVSWAALLPYRQTWAFAIGKFLTDMIWWFYIGWLPIFFAESNKFDLNLKKIGIPFIVIYLVSDLGSVFFGWLSSKLITNGWNVNRARKTVLLLCALCVVPVFFTAITDSIYVAVGLISLAAAAHQGWSANLFTTVTDMFPRRAVSSVTGIGGMMGALGGFLFSSNAGQMANDYGFISLFLIASSAYLVALAIIQLLVPKLEKAQLQ